MNTVKVINIKNMENDAEVLGTTQLSYLTSLIGLSAMHNVCSDTINDIHIKIQSIASTCSNLHLFAFIASKDEEQKKMFYRLKKQLRREIEEVILFVDYIYKQEKEENKNEKKH